MTYPSASDYVAAVQDRNALLDPELRRATFAVDPIWQIPRPPTGNSAVVFQATLDGQPRGFRFFIREDAATRERYNNLHTFLAHHRLADCTAAATWIDGAITVKGLSWPMVTMQWVEGRTLDAYVDYLVEAHDTSGLLTLADSWRTLLDRMQRVGFAHGDLQHGNVLVATDCTLRLVDFDGCWLPMTTGPPPNETGHPNYQLPSRPWGPWMDTFPALLVYTALRGLALRPELWRDYGARENILFTKDDFARPFETPVWADLQRLGDHSVSHGLTRLGAACEAAGNLPTTLEEVMAQTPRPRPRPAGEPAGEAGRSFNVSPFDRSRIWWTEAGAASASQTQQPTGSPADGHLRPPPGKTTKMSDPGNGFDGAHTRVWPTAPPPPPLGGPGGASSNLSFPPPKPIRPRSRRWVVWLIIAIAVVWVAFGLVSAYGFSATGASPPHSGTVASNSASPPFPRAAMRPALAAALPGPGSGRRSAGQRLIRSCSGAPGLTTTR